MHIYWLCEWTPRALLGPQSDSHLVKLHHCSVGTDRLSRPLCTNPDQILNIWVVSRFTRPAVVLEQATDPLCSHYVVADTGVHLLVSRHHVRDPARLAGFWHRPLILVFRWCHWSSLWLIHNVWDLLADHSLLSRSVRLFIFAMLDDNCDFSVLGDHFAPIFIHFA